MTITPSRRYWFGAGVAAIAVLAFACSRTSAKTGDLVGADAASKVYVAPGSKDELYAFLSGGFSGQVSVYGLPSGRLLKVIPRLLAEPGKRVWL